MHCLISSAICWAYCSFWAFYDHEGKRRTLFTFFCRLLGFLLCILMTTKVITALFAFFCHLLGFLLCILMTTKVITALFAFFCNRLGLQSSLGIPMTMKVTDVLIGFSCHFLGSQFLLCIPMTVKVSDVLNAFFCPLLGLHILAGHSYDHESKRCTDWFPLPFLGPTILDGHSMTTKVSAALCLLSSAISWASRIVCFLSPSPGLAILAGHSYDHKGKRCTDWFLLPFPGQQSLLGIP